MTYLLLKYLHVIGAIVLLGTGTGIAFFMLMAHRTGDAHHIAQTAEAVVVADAVFTAVAVLAQPVTGVLLARELSLPLTESWIAVSLGFYVVAGLFWLPVVWIQRRMRDLARQAANEGKALPDQYFRLFRVWFAFGFPGFGAVAAIVWLMIAKPSFGASP